MKNTLFIITIFSIFFYSCDQIDGPYLEDGNYCGNDSLSVPIKKILLEDYTGHKCGNCPEAHEKLRELKEIYCDHIIPVAVHVGFFAKPSITGTFTYDFRTETGKELDDYFGNSEKGLPNGMVNRSSVNSDIVLFADSWAIAINNLLLSPPDFNISIENIYNSETRKVQIKVQANALRQYNSSINLVVLIVEDSIVNWQKDYNADEVDIENYTHRHVLRDAVNFTWGEEFITGITKPNNSFEKTLNYTLNSQWNENHCEIIAYIYNIDTKEIIQAENEDIISH